MRKLLEYRGWDDDMSENYIIYVPAITAAAFTPSVTTINSKVVLEVFAEDVEKILEPIWFYSNEIYAGEV